MSGEKIPPCVCPLAGWCERYQRVQADRDLHFCRGESPAGLPPVNAQQQAHYRAKWLKAMRGMKPGVIALARNAAKAVKRVVEQKAKGKPVRVPPEVLAERRTHCDGCALRDPETDRCRHKACGCSLSSKRLLLGTVERPGKLELSTEKCPLGLWNEWSPAAA